MSEFEISELSFGDGVIGMSPIPGAKGDYAKEMQEWLAWKPDAVLSMTGQAEMKKLGSANVPDDLRDANVQWLHFPVDDFQAAPADRDMLWDPISQDMRKSFREMFCHQVLFHKYQLLWALVPEERYIVQQ